MNVIPKAKGTRTIYPIQYDEFEKPKTNANAHITPNVIQDIVSLIFNGFDADSASSSIFPSLFGRESNTKFIEPQGIEPISYCLPLYSYFIR